MIFAWRERERERERERKGETLFFFSKSRFSTSTWIPLEKKKSKKSKKLKQLGIDQLDQNKAVNKKGGVVGAFKGALVVAFIVEGGRREVE